MPASGAETRPLAGQREDGSSASSLPSAASAPRPHGPTAWRRWLAQEIEAERALRSGFALLPIGMMIAIGLVFGAGWRPAVWLGPAIGLASLGGSIAGAGWPFLRSVLLVPLGFALGLFASWVELTVTRTTLLSGDATVRIVGRVGLREQDDRGRYRYTIDLERTERPTLSRPPERVRVLVSSRHAPLSIGARYEGVVRLRPPAGPAFPGAYDFAFMPFFDGTGAFGYSLGPPEPSEAAANLSFMEWIADLRLGMGERIRAVLPDERGAVTAALINGERAGIPDEIENALRATGLAHVLSISGFHMALVAGMVMVLVRSVLAAFPSIALRWQVRKIAALAALFVTGFYFLLAGDNAATERSFIMIAIMLGAVLVDRPALTLRNVAIAALLVMAISPHALMTATFQMSFAATAALIGAYGAYARWSRGSEEEGTSFRTLLLVIVGVFVSSMIAGAATAPYGIYHFQRVAPFGLLANVLATPIFSFWIMPLALASVCLMPFGLEYLALHPIGWGLDLVFWMAKSFANTLPDYAVGQIGARSLLCFTAALLLLSFCQSRLRWTALVPLVLGLALIPPTLRPELLVSEDAKDVAVVFEDGRVIHLQKRPNRFISKQWDRAFELNVARGKGRSPGFECVDKICRAQTRSGLRVAWTDQLERIGEVCDTADVAIVARAPRMKACRSGARLVTLRTLRETGALALERDDAGWRLAASVPSPFEEWNRHRAEPWPERQARETFDRVRPKTGAPFVSDSAESVRRGDPEP